MRDLPQEFRRGLAAQSALIWVTLVMLPVHGCGLNGTEVGNGNKKKDPTGTTTTETNQPSNNSTGAPDASTSTASTGTGTVPSAASSANSPVSTGSDELAMTYMLADCGSPFADQVSGSFSRSQDASTTLVLQATQATGNAVDAVFLGSYSFHITQVNANSIKTTVTDPQGYELPTYLCADAVKSENISYLGVSGVTKRALNVTAQGGEAAVVWYQRLVHTTDSAMSVYRIEVTIGNVTYVYAKD